jgi:hypothetical protein
VEVVLIKRSGKAGERASLVAPAAYSIGHGDVLLLAGKDRDVNRMME